MAGPGLAPADTLPLRATRALPPVVAPTDTLVRILPCVGAAPRARVAAVLLVGNRVTRDRTLRAELNIREGDTLDLADLPARLEANRRRLFNLQLFHTVLVQASCQGNGQLVLLFVVQERFYTFPVPIFSIADRNFRAWLDRPDRWRRLDYGIHLTRNNFRGRNEELTANLQLGFNPKYELFYEAPGLGRARRVGVGGSISFSQSRSVDFRTVADRLLSYRADDAFPVQRFYASGGLRLRHTVQLLTALDVSYHREQILDSVNFYNPAYFLGRTQREYFDFSVITTLNQRNTFAYPLTGQYAQGLLLHRRFLSPGLPALTALRLVYDHYFALGHGFYYAFEVNGQIRLTRALAYADARALGNDALVRGYDAYVVDGRHYGLVQQGLSYRLFKASEIHLAGIENLKINTIPVVAYLNLFTDAGYVVAPAALSENQLPNHLLRSVGLGLHLVTYYDRVFTLEYTRNGLGQAGFFFRSSFPI
ncbi:POTRA domain-containing protein [Hymenobacter caeli]|uniref:Outer membrane protein assembly factor BamA n=1 Tax=Hymenobacter caeli TaxID=2735894 RepID=A0ABX2FMU3_9BACT|nr:POTRA domain-containing protein [Hymenobacter caeli]NRT18466.1 outer membrane protein assembly factor BamA [Hymenobacter caeli]